MQENISKRTTSVFQINRSHFELVKFKAHDDCIRFICKEHHASLEHVEGAMNLSMSTYGDIEHYFYHFEAYDGPSPWQGFIPKGISDGSDFRVRTLSFVLFMVHQEQIFCVIAGSGMMAIKRYINHHFGTGLYERISLPGEDNVLSVRSRGVTGGDAASSSVPRIERLVQEVLVFGMVPTNMLIELSEHISKDLFGFIASEKPRLVVEVAAYFKLLPKVSFEELQELIRILALILGAMPQKHLTCFVRVEDKEVSDGRYTQQLLKEIRDDMERRNSPARSEFMIPMDIDFMHPSLLESFVQSEVYKVYFKNSMKPAFEVQDRRTIYRETLSYIYQNYPNLSQFEFNGLIMSSRVKGFRGDRQSTTATVLQHITCEIEFNGRPVFHVDTEWYEARGNFEAELNSQFATLLVARNTGAGLFNLEWNEAMRTEAQYNNAYMNHASGKCFVLDTIVHENIELCDVLIWDSEELNFVHVKRGFDASMRDLSYQVLLSARRLASDKVSGQFDFTREIIRKYNAKGGPALIEEDLVAALQNFRVKFTMAIARPRSERPPIFLNHTEYKSNIAKFALLETSKHMSTSSFGFGVTEISLS
ncbi:MAG TPA: TIGR04141 family sporadically distributed protein [Flavobacteriales bacterium]|nr:TIGR04141 family sporadically distributed protein [Flavobacteriales bacterium]